MEELTTGAGQSFVPDAATLQAQFLARLYTWRVLHPTANIYALLDQNNPVAEHDDLHPSQLLKRQARRHTEAVLRPDLANEPNTLPLLVQLYAAAEHGYADEPLIGLTLRNALRRCRSVNGAYVAGWICTDAHPRVLADCLAKSGVVFALGQGRQRFVPFFEPYRMALLADDETSGPFLTRWLGPISHWLFVDSAGSLREVTPPTGGSTAGATPALREEQFASQSRVGIARFVVMALEKAGVLIAVRPERHIDKVIGQAQACGLREVEDIVFYALNSFTIGGGWASHPRAAAAIAKTASNADIRLADQLGALPDEVLNDIARGRNERT
jgi:hypothetical protein